MLITCRKCREEKDADEFSVKRSSPNGKQATCKECAKKITRDWNAANAERKKAGDAKKYQRNKQKMDLHNREWVAKNPDRRKAHARAYGAKNTDKVKIIGQKWCRDNKPRLRARDAKRRAIRHNATPLWANEVSISLIYREADRLSKSTGVIHEVDHILPLQSPLVCGLHWEANLQILERSKNRSKSNKLIL